MSTYYRAALKWQAWAYPGLSLPDALDAYYAAHPDIARPLVKEKKPQITAQPAGGEKHMASRAHIAVPLAKGKALTHHAVRVDPMTGDPSPIWRKNEEGEWVQVVESECGYPEDKLNFDAETVTTWTGVDIPDVVKLCTNCGNAIRSIQPREYGKKLPERAPEVVDRFGHTPQDGENLRGLEIILSVVVPQLAKNSEIPGGGQRVQEFTVDKEKRKISVIAPEVRFSYVNPETGMETKTSHYATVLAGGALNSGRRMLTLCGQVFASRDMNETTSGGICAGCRRRIMLPSVQAGMREDFAPGEVMTGPAMTPRLADQFGKNSLGGDRRRGRLEARSERGSGRRERLYTPGEATPINALDREDSKVTTTAMWERPVRDDASAIPRELRAVQIIDRSGEKAPALQPDSIVVIDGKAVPYKKLPKNQKAKLRKKNRKAAQRKTAVLENRKAAKKTAKVDTSRLPRATGLEAWYMRQGQ